MTSSPHLCALLLAALCLPAQAARPMITDDARVVDAKSCQIESWLRSSSEGSPQLWAVPGCAPVDKLELAVGGARQSIEGEPRLSDSLAQAKLLLRPLRPDDWGLALTLGRAVVHSAVPTRTAAASHFLNLPISQSLQGDALVLHLNLGHRQDSQTRRGVSTWGLGSEWQLRPGLQLIAETYGESGSRAFVHGGLRYWLVPDRVQIDTTYGTQTRWGGSQRWLSVGLRLLSPPLLP